MSDFYGSVPKTLKENLQYRANLQKNCRNNPKMQASLRHMCSQDILFWINSFCWLAEQRDGGVIPFITFDYQDDMILRMEQALGRKMIVGDKSRDCGFTWAVLYHFLYRCQFHRNQSFAVASRTDELVEKPGSPDCLFWKFDFALKQQPGWLTGKFHRTKKQLVWPDRVCDISGYATTKDIARGGRRLAILLDELAAFDFAVGRGCWSACESATNSIVAVSTHQGVVGAFADACRMAEEDPELFEQFVVRWWMDPRKNEGLEWRKDGCKAVPDHHRPAPGLQMARDGWKPWSKWYDWKCRRLFNNAMQIAREIDGDQSAASSCFFDPPEILNDAYKLCRPPLKKGRLVYDPDLADPIRFVEDVEGPLELWTSLGPDGKPPLDDYVNGVDVSAGVGATPSTMALVSKTTGEKLAQFAHARLKPNAFAKAAVSMCKWFHNAQLIWEAPGPGGEFTATVRLTDFRNVYRRRTNEGGLVPERKELWGWVPHGENKRLALEDFRDALGNEYTERSVQVLKECKDYSYSKDGVNVEQAKARDTDDPKSARMNHGDYVMASVLAWVVVKESRMNFSHKKNIGMTKRASPGSIAWIIEQERSAQSETNLVGGLRL